MHIGAFVRFHPRIFQANMHLALTGERGLVVSMADDGRQTSVVWPDGEQGTYRTKDLVRTVGVVGHVAKSDNERTKPFKFGDYRLPDKTAPRTVPAPLAGPSPTNFSVRAYLLKWYVDSPTEKTKSGKPVSMPMTMYKFHVTCKRSGASWVFSGYRRGGAWWYNDSRTKSLGLKDRPMSDAAFRAEVAKYTADPAGLWTEAGANTMGPTEYREMTGRTAV